MSTLRSGGRSTRIRLSGPRFCIWRAATDNDGIKAWSGQTWKMLGKWLSAGYARLTLETISFETAERRDGTAAVEIVRRGGTPAGSRGYADEARPGRARWQLC